MRSRSAAGANQPPSVRHQRYRNRCSPPGDPDHPRSDVPAGGRLIAGYRFISSSAYRPTVASAIGSVHHGRDRDKRLAGNAIVGAETVRVGHGSLLSFGHSCTLGAKAGRSDPRGSAGAGLGAADTGCIRNDSGRHALSDAHAGRGSGEWAVRGEARAETRVHVRTGIRNAVRRLVLSGSSSLATAGDVAAPSRMEQSVSAGGKPMLVVRSAIDRLRFSLRPTRTEVWSGAHAGRVEVLHDRSAASLRAADDADRLGDSSWSFGEPEYGSGRPPTTRG